MTVGAGSELAAVGPGTAEGAVGAGEGPITSWVTVGACRRSWHPPTRATMESPSNSERGWTITPLVL